MKRRSNTIGGGDAPPRLDASAYRGGSKAAAAAAAAVGAAATASSTGSGGSGSGSSKRGDGFARNASLSEGLKLSKPISQAARKPSSPLSLQLNGVKDRAGRVSGRSTTGARAAGGVRSELERWHMYTAARRERTDLLSYTSPFHFELPPKADGELDAEEFFKQAKAHRGYDHESKLNFYTLSDMNVGQRSFNPALYQTWHDDTKEEVRKRIAAVLHIQEEKERQKERLEAEERAKLQSVARTPRLKRDVPSNGPTSSSSSGAIPSSPTPASAAAAAASGGAGSSGNLGSSSGSGSLGSSSGSSGSGVASAAAVSSAAAAAAARTPRTPRLTESFANVDLEKTSVSLEKYAASTDLERSFNNLKISINPLLVMKHSEQQERRIQHFTEESRRTPATASPSGAPSRNSITHFGLGVLNSSRQSLSMASIPVSPLSTSATSAHASSSSSSASASSTSAPISISAPPTTSASSSSSSSASASASSTTATGTSALPSSPLVSSLGSIEGRAQAPPPGAPEAAVPPLHVHVPSRSRPMPSLLSFNGQVRINPLWQMQDTPEERRWLVRAFRRIKFRVCDALVKEVEMDRIALAQMAAAGVPDTARASSSSSAASAQVVPPGTARASASASASTSSTTTPPVITTTTTPEAATTTTTTSTTSPPTTPSSNNTLLLPSTSGEPGLTSSVSMDSLAAMANSPAKAPVRSVTAPSAHNGRDDVTPVVSPRYDHLKFASHSAPSFYPDILELQAACNAAAADLATLSRKSTAILPSPVLLPTEPAGGGTAGGSGTGGTGGGGGGGSGDAALPSAHASASPPPVDACTAPASPSSSSSSSVSSASPRPPAPPSPSIHRAAAIVPAPEVTAASAAAAAAAAAANQHQQQQHQQPQPLSARSSSSSSSSTAAAAAALPLLRAAEDASTWKFERETHFNSPLSVLEFSPSVRVLVGGQVALLLKRETGVLFRYLQNQQVPLSRASPEQIAYMHQVGAIRPTVQSATFIPYTAGLEFIAKAIAHPEILPQSPGDHQEPPPPHIGAAAAAAPDGTVRSIARSLPVVDRTEKKIEKTKVDIRPGVVAAARAAVQSQAEISAATTASGAQQAPNDRLGAKIASNPS